MKKCRHRLAVKPIERHYVIGVGCAVKAGDAVSVRCAASVVMTTAETDGIISDAVAAAVSCA